LDGKCGDRLATAIHEFSELNHEKSNGFNEAKMNSKPPVATQSN
jgi:hypothetical protein